MLVQSVGTVASQAIPILVSPVLTRIFSPQDFGLYGLVVSISTLLAIFVTLRLDHGIIVSASDAQAKDVAILSLAMAFFGSLLFALASAVIVLALYGVEADYLLTWAFFGPLLGFLSAAVRTLTLYNNRLNFFSQVSRARIVQSILTAICSVILGFLAFRLYGLIWGLVAGNLIFSLMLGRALLPATWVSRGQALEIFRLNKDFIRFSLPADLVNNLAGRMPFILFPVFFGLEQTGYLSLAFRVVATPSRFVGTAIGEVFYSHSAREYERTGSCWNSVRKVLLMLAISGTAGFVVLFFIADTFFVILFGPQWAPAALYTQILTPMLLVSFVVSPLSVVLYIASRQKEDFYWQIVFLLVTALACCVGVWHGGAIVSLVALSASGVVMYLAYYVLIRKYAGTPRPEPEAAAG